MARSAPLWPLHQQHNRTYVAYKITIKQNIITCGCLSGTSWNVSFAHWVSVTDLCCFKYSTRAHTRRITNVTHSWPGRPSSTSYISSLRFVNKKYDTVFRTTYGTDLGVNEDNIILLIIWLFPLKTTYISLHLNITFAEIIQLHIYLTSHTNNSYLVNACSCIQTQCSFLYSSCELQDCFHISKTKYYK